MGFFSFFKPDVNKPLHHCQRLKHKDKCPVKHRTLCFEREYWFMPDDMGKASKHQLKEILVCPAFQEHLEKIKASKAGVITSYIGVDCQFLAGDITWPIWEEKNKELLDSIRGTCGGHGGIKSG